MFGRKQNPLKNQKRNIIFKMKAELEKNKIPLEKQELKRKF